MRILQITAHFYPNLGGIETHLSDLVRGLSLRGYEVFVLTYQPLHSKVPWKFYEVGKNLTVLRIPWVPGLFYYLVKFPLLEFLYLLPGLFILTPFIILFKNPEVIHAHGLVAGFVAVLWAKVFNIKVIVSTHSIYHFPKKGLYKDFVTLIFKNSNWVSGLSKQAADEIKALGVSSKRIKVFTYWIDLDKFKVQSTRSLRESRFKIKKQLGWDKKFVVLFVGRLVPEKGIRELLEALKEWSDKIYLTIIGTGPLEDEIKEVSKKHKNLKFIGRVEQDNLPDFYNAVDMVIVPSTHEEGFGRVVMESLACGTPVIAAKRGAIPEAMDETVGKFIDVSPKSIKDVVEYFFDNKKALEKKKLNTRKFAERRYSEKNIEIIIKSYKS